MQLVIFGIFVLLALLVLVAGIMRSAGMADRQIEEMMEPQDLDEIGNTPVRDSLSSAAENAERQPTGEPGWSARPRSISGP